LINDIQFSGQKSIIWDGKDNLGNIVSSGVYIYQIKAGNKIITKKMLFVK